MTDDESAALLLSAEAWLGSFFQWLVQDPAGEYWRPATPEETVILNRVRKTLFGGMDEEILGG